MPLSQPQPPPTATRGHAHGGGRGHWEGGQRRFPKYPERQRELKFQHGVSMAQLRPRDAAGDGLPLSTRRGGGNPPSSWGPSGPAKNRRLGHPRALSGQPLTGRRPQETPRSQALPRSRGRALSGPARPGGPSELARRGGPVPAGAPPRRAGAQGLPGGQGQAAVGVRAPGPRPRSGAALLPALGHRGWHNPPPRGPRDRRQARRGLLTLTLSSRERRPGRRGGTGTTARAARSEAPPPPPQLLRCRRAARQETGSFGAGRPPARPGVWAGGARRPAP